MSPLHVFEIFFILAQILRHSMEAIYFLANKHQDVLFRYAVGFGSFISAFWFLVAFLNLKDSRLVSQG